MRRCSAVARWWPGTGSGHGRRTTALQRPPGQRGEPVQRTSIKVWQFVEGRRWCPWAGGGFEKARVCAGDQSCHGEERRCASARCDARQRLINGAELVCSLQSCRCEQRETEGVCTGLWLL